jgi:tetraprenyl-beta-curcumene synthase
VGGWAGTDGALTLLASAAGRYWLGVFPDVRRETRAWRGRARRIPDPTLRRLALRAHREKGGNLEGAAAFATFAHPGGRHAVVCAAVAYQTLFDYLDNLSEEPNADPIANGWRLNDALLSAVAPERAQLDCYALRTGGGADGGYLRTLVQACRAALTALPAFHAVAELVYAASARVVAYQSLNHGDGDGRHDSFENWARALSGGCPGLTWWETGAAAGSTLDLLALVAAAADPDLDRASAMALARAYFPWVGALHSLLDSLADRPEDLACGTRGLIDYYRSPAYTAERLSTIGAAATRQVAALPEGPAHTLLVAAMASFYLCDLSEHSSPHARLAVPALVATMGRYARPTLAILRGRRVAGRLGEGLIEHLARWPARPCGHRLAAVGRGP